MRDPTLRLQRKIQENVSPLRSYPPDKSARNSVTTASRKLAKFLGLESHSKRLKSAGIFTRDDGEQIGGQLEIVRVKI